MLIADKTLLTENVCCDSLTIEAVPEAPEGKILCMTVNHVPQDLKPGSYAGDIQIYVLDIGDTVFLIKDG